jgi:hypothetical protein
MLDLQLRRRPIDIPHERATSGMPRSGLELELHVLAEDLAGHLDRDELSRADEERLADALDAAVAAVMPAVIETMDRELTPRLEALPLSARLVLSRARSRLEFGVD